MPEDEVGEKLRAALHEALAVLRELAIPHALFGGLAVNALDCPRFTDDVDLVVRLDDAGLERFLQALGARGFELRGDPAERFRRDAMMPASYRGAKVDFLGAEDPLSAETLARAREGTSLGETVRVARPEELIVLKMIPRREQDMLDIKALLTKFRGRLDLEHIRRWVREIEDFAPGAIDLFEKLVREFHDPLPERGDAR